MTGAAERWQVVRTMAVAMRGAVDGAAPELRCGVPYAHGDLFGAAEEVTPADRARSVP